MTTPTYQQVLDAKNLSDAELTAEFKKLCRYKCDVTKRCFAGNPILYHYQLDNLCRVAPGKNASFHAVMSDDAERERWWTLVNKYANGSRPGAPAMRLFELWRRMSGAIVFFKPTVAMNVYSQAQATAVLDPCAGWGGRMLGALAKNIRYVGIDTNLSLKPAYDAMMAKFNTASTAQMIWQDALTVDFSTIDYDCVLTSPPYLNLELYPGMTPFASDEAFYKGFLIPLIDKCRRHIRRGGRVCFNISPKMYRDLTVTHSYPVCQSQIAMLQQKVRGKDKEDQVYCWLSS